MSQAPEYRTTRDLLPAMRAEEGFKDYKPGFNALEAAEEASRCINCYGAPCITACPTAINIPQFISRIANDNVRGAAKTILESNILGLSCARSCPTEVLCEGACVHNDLSHKPIAIGKLQRYAVEKAYEKGEKFFEAGKPTEKRVALVGAGPASLACAHELRLLGHEAVIFEKSQLPGGLNTSGIAPYKMKAETSLEEISQVLAIGARIDFSRELGRDLDLMQLIRDYDAVFLGIGLGPDSRLDAPGSTLPGIRGAVEFIAEMKNRPMSDLVWLKGVTTALVVGGGNTALDACRELKGLGVPRVIVSYRRGEADMSGYAHELKAARQEGVEFWFNTVPTEFVEARASLTHGRGSAVEARVRKTVLGQHGQLVMADESIALETELVLMATGQSKLESLFKAIPGLVFQKGRLLTDPGTGATGHQKIFAGGDLANGGMEVVHAVAEGKRAARGIDTSIRQIEMKG